MRKELLKRFSTIYGKGGEVRTFFAPGRVNLIGEHTDYNGGHVLPCALNYGTWLLARKREDQRIRFYSENFSERGIIEGENIENLPHHFEDGWTDYVRGVIWTLRQKGVHFPQGLDLMISGNIPSGAGLSSSAALEVVTGLALRELYGLKDLSLVDLAQIGQYAENHYIGMQCGIMDQFISAMGRKDCAIFLDTNSLRYEYVPVQLENKKIVIINSKVKHSLVDSAYNIRRQECEEALHCLQKVVPIQALGDLTEEGFEKAKDVIPQENWLKRARHAVYENQRTIQAAEALQKGDIARFGQLMKESHISLRDDYQVSCPEIDLLVEAAWKQPGVIGSRITGGGFGGCTVSLIREEAVGSFCENIAAIYKKETGIDAEIYVARIGDGAREVVG